MLYLNNSMFNLFLFLTTILLSQPALASTEFSSTQQINYQVSSDGTAKAYHKIEITNNISQIYPKEYYLTISEPHLSQVTATDSNGNILSSTTPSNDSSALRLVFNQPAIGKGQTTQFNIEYTITNFAKKKGSTWEIFLPRFSSEITNTKVSVLLTVPESFGEISFSSPQTVSSHLINGTQQIRFSLPDFSQKSYFIFGNSQLFDFHLTYYLSNSSSTDSTYEIAIPPNTNTQTITYRSLNPPPQDVYQDTDGNWLARYPLSSGSNQTITVSGQAKTHPSLKKESTSDSTTLTSAQKYWPVTDPQILSLSSTYNTPEKIYRYVINTLNYDTTLSAPTRKGAIATLLNPQSSVCTDFTDLFVTLARASQIPSREIEGFAYSNNQLIRPTSSGTDILHAWPQYFDKATSTWMDIDPTWEKTTNGIDYFHDLDLNHITFVIHGKTSDSPPPPGSYKQTDQKSVVVEYAPSPIVPENLPLQLNLNQNNELTVYNPNLYALSDQNIKLLNTGWQQTLSLLPPLSHTSLQVAPLSLGQKLNPASGKLRFQVTTPTNQYLVEKINPGHFLQLSFIIGTAILILCLGGIILTSSPRK